MPFADYVTLCQSWVDQGLKARLDRLTAPPLPARLHEALAYTALSPGKRLRPLLVRAVCEALEGPVNAALPAACAIELVHTYSLVHDDLPAMDNDDLRRGRPSCHKAFDEATAILTGDALLTLAFEVMADNSVLSPALCLEQIRQLTHAAGCQGMIAGQSLDMQVTGASLDRAGLTQLHSRKTGALIRAACHLGALSAGAGPEVMAALEDYACATGVAFQVQDDILDATTQTATLGKPQGRDKALGKVTYVSLLGLDQARQEARQLRDKARDALEQAQALLPGKPAVQRLEQLADHIIERSA